MARPKDQNFNYSSRFGFLILNNEAECEALIKGIELVVEVGVKKLITYRVSELVVEQVNKNYKAKKLSMVKYLRKVK